MNRFTKLLAGVVLALGIGAASPAMAQHWHGHGGGHYGGWHGGHGWHGGGWGGPGITFGFGTPYYAAPYYYGGNCGWVRQRYLRHGYWHLRRVWRCW